MGKWWYTDSQGKRKRTKLGIRHEYDAFQSSEEQIKKRSSRNSARRSAIKSGIISARDKRVIDHKNSNPLDNRKSNLRAMSRSANAGKIEDSRKRGSKRRTWK